ncbi:MAG: hypothetical protein ACLTZI_03620 [[Eubacterium] siraeum]
MNITKATMIKNRGFRLSINLYIFENGCLALLAMLVLHRAKLLASNQSVLALGVAPSGVRVAATLSPGTDAGRSIPKALHDAEPTKHTQPFTDGNGFGVRVREFAIFLKINFFYKLKPR